MRCGAELAVEKINAAGGVLGRQIRLLVFDNLGSPEKAKAVTEYAITKEKVVAVTGFYHSGCCLASIEVVHNYHIPLVVADASADEITAKKYPEVFRIGLFTSAKIETMVAFVKEPLEAGRVKSMAVMHACMETSRDSSKKPSKSSSKPSALHVPKNLRELPLT